MLLHWVLLAILAATPTAGQSLFGTILGSVSDSTQARIAGAVIKVRNTRTNAVRTVRASASGDYEMPALPVGEYELTAEAPGFRTHRVTGAVLQVDQRLRLDLTLQLGEVAQSIEVAAAARLIETDNATQGTVIDNRRIVELPLNGRNFQQLASLGPGVVAPVPGSGDRISVAGARNLSVGFLMDGTTNSNTNANTAMISPSIDLIQEFKVLRNSFAAEFGHGAAQINLVTKSGGNQFHMTLFEFLRNDKLQARDFFDAAKPALRRNQFGGTGSGPVFIPWLYDGRNKSFWLINYEAFRQRTPNTIRASFPTQAELDGNLTATTGALNDPFANNVPFPGRIIPPARINSSTRAYRQFMPVTNLARGTFGQNFNLLHAGSGRSASDQLTLRYDHNFSPRSNGFVRHTLNDVNSLPLAIFPFYTRVANTRQQNGTAGHNLVIRPNLINEFRFGFARHNANLSPGSTSGGRNFAAEIGLRNLLSIDNPKAYSPPAVAITGFSGAGGIGLITQRVNTFSYVDNLSYILAKHSIKAGVDIRRVLHDTRNIGATHGTFAFQGNFSGSPLGDFLLGFPRTASGTAPPGVDGVNLATLWQGFVQDDWKIVRNLTINLGLRYEYYSPWINNRNRISRFDPYFPGGRVIYPAENFYFVPGPGFIPTDRPLANRGLYEPDRNDFGPRFGFAWRPRGSNRSAVRGSYGIFIDNSNETNHIFSIGNPPHLLQHNIVNDAARPPLTPWSSMFPAQVTAFSAQVNTVAPELPSAYVQQWSLNLQREVTPELAVELGYSGAKGTNLDQRLEWNQARRSGSQQAHGHRQPVAVSFVFAGPDGARPHGHVELPFLHRPVGAQLQPRTLVPGRLYAVQGDRQRVILRQHRGAAGAGAECLQHPGGEGAVVLRCAATAGGELRLGDSVRQGQPVGWRLEDHRDHAVSERQSLVDPDRARHRQRRHRSAAR